MAFVYEDGKEYVRPAVYRRSRNGNTTNAVTSALDGIGALPIRADWGEIGKVTTHYKATANTTIKSTYGDGGTTSVAYAFMKGGLSTLHLVRIGTGGTAGAITLKAGETDAVTLTLKYPGAHPFTVSVRDKLGVASTKELVIYDGAKAVETIDFTSGTDEPEKLVEAIAAANSSYVTATMTEGATGSLTAIAQQSFAGGVDPTVTAADYSTAFEAFDPYYYNTIALDTIDADVQSLLVEHIDASIEGGNLGIAVIGTTGTTPLSTRMSNAAAIDDYPIIYFGSDYLTSDGSTKSGAEAIATAAGVIASTPSNRSIVRREIPGAAALTERLKNSDYEAAIKKGLLLLSVSANGAVVFDSGVNTLIRPDVETQDDGWKKIKRVKVRHETYYRLDSEMDKLIGVVPCTEDGIANVIQVGQRVLDTMASEGKLTNPTFTVNKEKGYGPDYAYFVIEAVDVDTLERIFLDYSWKYSENS